MWKRLLFLSDFSAASLSIAFASSSSWANWSSRLDLWISMSWNSFLTSAILCLNLSLTLCSSSSSFILCSCSSSGVTRKLLPDPLLFKSMSVVGRALFFSRNDSYSSITTFCMVRSCSSKSFAEAMS